MAVTTGYSSLIGGMYFLIYILVLVTIVSLLIIFLFLANRYMKEKSIREEKMLAKMDRLLEMLEKKENLL